jgi:hypothetical protein
LGNDNATRVAEIVEEKNPGKFFVKYARTQSKSRSASGINDPVFGFTGLGDIYGTAPENTTLWTYTLCTILPYDRGILPFLLFMTSVNPGPN